ncbi:hypothetical protein GCM10009624_16170 [Gordonia sinesedis]
MTEVDPAILRAFAQQTSSTADTIDVNTLDGRIEAAFAGMPGSTSAYEAIGVDAYVGDQVQDLSRGFDDLARAAKGSADSYDTTDEALARAISAVFAR